MAEVVVGQVYGDLLRLDGRPDRELRVTCLLVNQRFVEVVVLGRTGGQSSTCTCGSGRPGSHDTSCPAWGVAVGRRAIFEKRLLGNVNHPLLRDATTVGGSGNPLTNPTIPG